MVPLHSEKFCYVKDECMFQRKEQVFIIFLLQYDTDYYILDKYPLAVRPFYTMPDPNDPVSDM